VTDVFIFFIIVQKVFTLQFTS